MEKKTFRVVLKSRKIYAVRAINNQEALELVKFTTDLIPEIKNSPPICYKYK